MMMDDSLKRAFAKAVWIAVLVFLPLSFVGLYLRNFSGGFEGVAIVAATLVWPAMMLDAYTGVEPNQQISGPWLWIIFAVVQYVWFLILVTIILLFVRGVTAKNVNT